MAKRITILLMLGLIASSSFLIGGMAYFTYRQVLENISEQGRQNAMLGARMTSYVLEKAIDNGIFEFSAVMSDIYQPDKDFVSQKYDAEYAYYLERNMVNLLDAFLEAESIYYAYPIKLDGYVPISSDPLENREKLSPVISSLEQSREGRMVVDREHPFYEYSWPIKVKGQVWGYFRVGVPVQHVQNQIIAEISMAVILTVACCSVFGVLIYMVIRRNLKPLSKLTQITTMMASGDLGVRCKEQREDEIGWLAESFNQMAESLEEREINLRAANEKLEDRVRRRTQELEKINRELHDEVGERKRTEDDLRREKDFIERLIETAQVVVLVLDTKGNIVRYNRYLEELTGYKLSDYKGWNWFDIFVPGLHRQEVMGVFQKTLEGEPTSGTINNVITQDNMDCQVEWANTCLRDAEGEVIGVLSIGQDITERRRMEMQLIQAQKMESIGHLAAGIAHEINTPMQFVSDNVRFLKDTIAELFQVITTQDRLRQHLREGNISEEFLEKVDAQLADVDLEYLRKEVPSAIEESLDGLSRVGKIVLAMKEFSHPGVDEKMAIDINHAIESTITISRNEWKYVADMEMDFDPILPVVECFPGEFNQVILNLLTNAAHAVEAAITEDRKKGTIRVSTHRDGDWAEIHIQDSGIGIPKAIHKKIFMPFFTTKDVGKGTGQGLALCYNVIVDKHQGQINFDSEPGKGTTFVIRLPIHEVVQAILEPS